MRRHILIVGLMLAVLGGAEGARITLANQGLRGLQVHTIEGVLRLEPDQVDIGTAALIISRQWGTTKTLHTYRGRIDDMAREILRRLDEKKLTADYLAIPVINEYLFQEMGFRPVETADDPEDLFLHVVLDRKRGYCLSLSVLYLAIGERIGMPLYGVVVPGHFFVRYDDGRRQYNIETTSGGNIASDEHYLEKFKVPKDHPLYLKNLDKMQTLGCFFNNLGNSYSTVGQSDQAFLELSRAVRINPSLAEARLNFGNLCLEKGLTDKAIEEYEQARRILPHDPRVLSNLGSAWLEKKDYKQALSHLRQSLDIDPTYHDARRTLARVLHADGQTGRAVSEMKALTALERDNPDNYFLLGCFLQDRGDLHEAREQYLRVLRYRPDSSDARTHLGQVYQEMDQPEWAAETFGEAVRLNPEDVSAWFGLAMAFGRLERTADEIGAYEKVLSLEPGLTAAVQNMGNALIRADRTPEAVEWYLHGLKLEPDNTGLWYNLGVAYAKLELYAKAVEAYEAVLRREPTSAAAHHGLAVCCYYLKEKERMRIHARRAKELGYDVPEVLLKQ